MDFFGVAKLFPRYILEMENSYFFIFSFDVAISKTKTLEERKIFFKIPTSFFVVFISQTSLTEKNQVEENYKSQKVRSLSNNSIGCIIHIKANRTVSVFINK